MRVPELFLFYVNAQRAQLAGKEQLLFTENRIKNDDDLALSAESNLLIN
jgi:hypothetical protein